MDNDLLPAASKWSVKRIVAGLVVLAVAAGLIFAALNIHSHSPKPSASRHAAGLSNNSPAFSPSPQTQQPSVSPSSSAGQAASGTSQLSNTGPGSDALIGFIVAFIGGAVLHNYHVRKKVSPKSRQYYC